MSAVQGWDRLIYTLAVQRPQPHNTPAPQYQPIDRKKSKGNMEEDKMG